MAEAVAAAATAFAAWASATAYAVATAVGVSAATASTISIYAAAIAYASVGWAAQAAVAIGLSAITSAQIPDPESGKQARRQSRPLRFFAVGGSSRLSGAYMLRETVGNKLGIVLAICDGRLASVDRIYLNDDLVTLDGSGWVQGMENEKYGTGDLVRISTRLGLPTETRHTILDPAFTSLWPSTARGDGIASLALFAQHRSKESFGRHFPNGEPMPSVAVTPVCYDWRDVTQDREDETTWKACANPVVWLVFCEWYRFGRSWTRCVQPVLASLTDEADYCDELVAKKGGGTEPRYVFGGNYASNTEPAAIRNAILSTMDGWLSIDGKGAIIIKAGRYVEPTFTITSGHIEGYSWKAFNPDEDACNELIVSHVDPAQDFTDVEAGVWQDEEDITATGRVRTENLALTWVPSRSQAMRLAKRKMTRLNAKRRGSIRTGIYGLNGLGERYIRVQNQEVTSMADVVVEVVNIEFDPSAAQVVFEVVLADQTIDEWDPDTDEGTTGPTVTRPGSTGANSDTAETPITQDPSQPITGGVDEIVIANTTVVVKKGEKVITGDTIPGLDSFKTYGVFWREDVGFEAEEAPALDHMREGSWIFLGWQSTSDGTDYPTPEPPPPGSGGSGKTPITIDP